MSTESESRMQADLARQQSTMTTGFRVAAADDAARASREDAARSRAKATSARNQRDEAQSSLAKSIRETEVLKAEVARLKAERDASVSRASSLALDVLTMTQERDAIKERCAKLETALRVAFQFIDTATFERKPGRRETAVREGCSLFAIGPISCADLAAAREALNSL